MANLNRSQTPSEKHKQNAAQFAELNKAIEEHSKKIEETRAVVEEAKEEREDAADKEVEEVLGNDEGYAPYGTPEWYEQEYVKQLPPPLRALISPDARKKLEATLPELDIGDILLAQAEQNVPIIPGKFSATFRVLTTDEEIYVEDLISQDKAVTQKQVVSLINVFRLAMSITEIGGDRLPEHRKKDGTIDKDIVKKRIMRIRMQANPLTVLLTTHLGWWDRRVYAALAGDSLKNG